MVKGILQMLGKEVRGLHEAAYLLGAFALFSQALALIRDRLLTHEFGAGDVLDIYYAAFRIPDFIFVTVASIVSLSVLIPFLVERAEKDERAGQDFISGIFSFFALSILVVSGVVYIFVPELVHILFPGLSPALYDELVLMTRILLFQPIFLGASSLFASVVHVYKRFLLYAISPLLYNLGIIIGVVFFYDIVGIVGLAYGVVLGAVMHMALQLPFIIQSGYAPRLSFMHHAREIKNVIFLSLPRTLALSAHQIAFFFLVGLASFMGIGSIAVFHLAFNLQSVPLSIIGASYSVAAFPTLAHLFTNGNTPEFFAHIAIAARHIIFWSFPGISLFIILRAQIVRVILGSGEFTWTDTRLTAAALALFIISLIAQSLVLLFVRGYYAAGRTIKPLIINVSSAVLIILGAFVFTYLFETYDMWRFFIESLLRVEGIPGTEVLMLPLSYSLAMLINATLFWVAFQRDFSYFSKTLSVTFFQSMASAVVMGFTAYYMLDILDEVFSLDTFAGILGQGLIAGVVGIISGVIVLRLLGSKELAEAETALHKKFWKTTVISSE